MLFLKKHPFAQLLLIIIFAIFFGEILSFSLNVLIILAVLSTIILFLSFFLPYIKYKQLPFYIPFSVFIIVATLLSLHLKTPKLPRNSDSYDSFIAVVSEPTEEKTNSVSCLMNLRALHDSVGWSNSEGKVMVYLRKDSAALNVQAGDILLINSSLKTIDPPKNPNAFDYRLYMARRGVLMQIFADSTSWQFQGVEKSYSILIFAGKIRNKLMESLRSSGLSGDEMAVASAILLGYGGDIEPDLRKAYSGAGAMHILCVSGMHVGIVFLIFSLLLKPFSRSKKGKRFSAIILILLIWLYATITGLSPSVTRAALMLSFVTVGNSLNRKTSIWDSLAASAFFMLLFDPLLLFNPGFQLSYAAVISIVALQPPLANIFTVKNKIVKWVWALITVSFTAQIGTAPIAIYYFHQFPNYFLITNMYVMIFCSLIIYLGIAVLIFGFWPLLAALLSKILYYSIFAMNYGVRLIESMPGSVTNGLFLSLFSIVLIYLIIFYFSRYLLYIQRRSFVIALTLVLLFCSFEVFQLYQSLKQQSIMFYHMPKYIVVDIVRGSSAVQIADPLLRNESDKLGYVAKEYRLKKSYSKDITKIYIDDLHFENRYFLDSSLWISGGQFQFLDKKFAFYNPELSRYTFDEKLEIDYLIINGDVFDSVSELSAIYNPDCIIFSTSIPSYVSKRMEQKCSKSSFVCRNIWNEGAICFDYKNVK